MSNARRLPLVRLPGAGMRHCSVVAPTWSRKDQTKKLDQAVRSYIHAVRWGDLGAAASYIRPREGKLKVPDLKEFKGSACHRTTTTPSTPRPKATPEALMTAAFDYYFEDTLSVKKATQQVIWWWDPSVQNWFMDGELPDFER